MNANLLEGTAVDFFMESLFDAYEEVAQLREVKNVVDARRRAERIAASLELALGNLAEFGVHAGSRWDQIRRRYTD
jgi:hypothetical protein